MKRIIGKYSLVAVVTSSVLLVGNVGAAGAITSNPVTKTFSFIGKLNSKTSTIVNIDSLVINARCSSSGSPLIFAFSGAQKADLFGRFFDGLGRLHIVKNSSFVKGTSGVALYPSSNDFDATGAVLFEVSDGTVVTVNYAFDNSTTLAKQNVCTVYGSYVAS
jgi:PKD repeat protein